MADVKLSSSEDNFIFRLNQNTGFAGKGENGESKTLNKGVYYLLFGLGLCAGVFIIKELFKGPRL